MADECAVGGGVGEVKKSRRGFSAMDPEKQREIARLGGRAAHAKGTAHQFTVEEARVAGKIGGLRAQELRRAHRFSSEEAREAGRIGGLRCQALKREKGGES